MFDKKYQVIADGNEYEITDKRIENFIASLEYDGISYTVKEVNPLTCIDNHRGQWYIEYKDTDIIYFKDECSMWKNLYLGEYPILSYGRILD